MTIIITIVDDEKSKGSYGVIKIENADLDTVEKAISDTIWGKFSK